MTDQPYQGTPQPYRNSDQAERFRQFRDEDEVPWGRANSKSDAGRSAKSASTNGKGSFAWGDAHMLSNEFDTSSDADGSSPWGMRIAVGVIFMVVAAFFRLDLQKSSNAEPVPQYPAHQTPVDRRPENVERALKNLEELTRRLDAQTESQGLQDATDGIPAVEPDNLNAEQD